MPPTESSPLTPVPVWGLPLAPLTMTQAIDLIERWVGEQTPRYVITANLHYAMLTAEDHRLGPVNRGAALVLADGMPLVWGSRGRLPERVAGSDLVPNLCARAAARGFRVYFYGGAPGVAEEAARRLVDRHPGLKVVGVATPPFRPLTSDEQEHLLDEIRVVRPDLLFLAFSQPAGEIWMAEHCGRLGVPVTVQMGATIDFMAGRVRRAPRWAQRIGMEWAYRLYREPKRLASRYAKNAWFLGKALLGRVPHEQPR